MPTQEDYATIESIVEEKKFKRFVNAKDVSGNVSEIIK